MRESKPESAIIVVSSTKPRGISADDAQTMQFANAGQIVGLPKQHRRGDAETSGELFKFRERPRESFSKQFRIKKFVRSPGV